MQGLPATSSICTRFSRSGPMSMPIAKTLPALGNRASKLSIAGLKSLCIFMRLSVDKFIIGSIGNHQLRHILRCRDGILSFEYDGRGGVDQHACAVVRAGTGEPLLREVFHVPFHPARTKRTADGRARRGGSE